MTPKEEYFQICVWRKIHPLPKGEYGENHHILPKSCGGPNLPWNIVRLSAQEHFRCHCLLPYVFEEFGLYDGKKKMLFAWHILSGRIANTVISADEFASLRKQYGKAKSESLLGHGFFKKKRKRKLSKAQRSKIAKKAREKLEAKRVEAQCIYCGTMNRHDD